MGNASKVCKSYGGDEVLRSLSSIAGDLHEDYHDEEAFRGCTKNMKEVLTPTCLTWPFVTEKPSPRQASGNREHI